MNFFDDFPKPDPMERAKNAKFVPPPWVGPPQDELPAVLHIGQFLYRSPTRVLTVKSADVYTTGCSFQLAWIIRRGEESEEEWTALHASVFQHGPGMGPTSADLQLLLGVQLPDGTRARTGIFGWGRPVDLDKEPEAPALTFRGGGGSSNDDEVSASGNLWLWPLPADGELRLLAQWKGLGIGECSVAIDGSNFSSAAARALNLWP